MPSKILQLLISLLLLLIMILPFRAISAFGEECAGAVRPIRLYHKEAKNYLGIRTERRTDRNRSTIVAKSPCRHNCEIYMIANKTPGLHYIYIPYEKMFLCYIERRKTFGAMKWSRFPNNKTLCLFNETKAETYTGYIQLVNIHSNTKLMLTDKGHIPSPNCTSKHPKRHCKRIGFPEFIKSPVNTTCQDARTNFCKDCSDYTRTSRKRNKIVANFRMCNEI